MKTKVMERGSNPRGLAAPNGIQAREHPVATANANDAENQGRASSDCSRRRQGRLKVPPPNRNTPRSLEQHRKNPHTQQPKRLALLGKPWLEMTTFGRRVIDASRRSLWSHAISHLARC